MAAHKEDLELIRSFVDQIECDCEEWDDDWKEHDQCCRVYLYGYIGQLIDRLPQGTNQ